MNPTEHEGLIHQNVMQFTNILQIDPSLTIEDLKSEIRVLLLRLNPKEQELASCNLSTFLTRKIKQRLIDIYRTARRKSGKIDREVMIDTLVAKGTEFSRIEFDKLPPHMQQLVRMIYENPEKLNITGKIPNNINKGCLFNYLTKDLSWGRKEAKAFADIVIPPRLKSKSPHKNHASN